MMQRARRTWSNRLALLIGVSALALAGQPASADEWLDNLNKLAEPAPGEQDGTKILFDAIAGMDIVPDAIVDQDLGFEPARKIIPGMSRWDELAAWSSAPAQQNVLDAVATITERKERYILGLPYSNASTPSAWSDKMLFVSLPEDGLLMNAGLLYQFGMDRAFAAHWIEMARLASEDDAEGAIGVMERAVRLSRILMERPTSREVSYATDKMIKTFEKILDTCRSFPDAFGPSDLADLNRRFEERRLLLDRIALPMGDKEIAGQLVARGIEERRGADGVRLAELMSGIAVDPNTRPLERFSRAAHWKTIAEQHADWFATTDQLDNLFGDWDARWGLPDLKDPMLKRLTDYQKMDKRRFLILEESLSGYEGVFTERMNRYTSANGSRNAIAVMGFFARSDRFPPELPAVQPQFIKKLDVDPYSIMPIHQGRKSNYRAYTRWEKHEAFEYFVPIRDQTFDRREEPKPYEVIVQLKGGASAADVGVIDPEMYALGARLFSNEIKIFREKFAGTAFPSGAFDAKAGEYDVELLRPFLMDWAGDYEATADETRAMQLIFDRFKQLPGFSADMIRADKGSDSLIEDIRAGIRADLIAGGVTEDVLEDDAAWREVFGISGGEYIEAIAMYAHAFITSDRCFEAIDKVLRGEYLTRSDFQEIVVGLVENSMNESFMMDFMGYATKVYNSPVGEALFTGHEVAAESFKVKLDDKTFILYSVGPDEVDNDAKNTYPPGISNMRSGTDVLIYPPALSLQREQGGF